jgi:membrane protein DedA with SNARE-associated domain
VHGRKFGPRLAVRLLRGERPSDLWQRAERQIRRRGITIVIVGRFIPAGRTATTFACGTVRYPYRRFLLSNSLAGGRLGHLHRAAGIVGGNTFRNRAGRRYADRPTHWFIHRRRDGNLAGCRWRLAA